MTGSRTQSLRPWQRLRKEPRRLSGPPPPPQFGFTINPSHGKLQRPNPQASRNLRRRVFPDTSQYLSLYSSLLLVANLPVFSDLADGFSRSFYGKTLIGLLSPVVTRASRPSRRRIWQTWSRSWSGGSPRSTERTTRLSGSSRDDIGITKP